MNIRLSLILHISSLQKRKYSLNHMQIMSNSSDMVFIAHSISTKDFLQYPDSSQRSITILAFNHANHFRSSSIGIFQFSHLPSSKKSICNICCCLRQLDLNKLVFCQRISELFSFQRIGSGEIKGAFKCPDGSPCNSVSRIIQT